uniref:Secreted protein n=1 Tax=Globodera pallida TaxID=36090 RepID=A0A183CL83_GLOPA
MGVLPPFIAPLLVAVSVLPCTQLAQSAPSVSLMDIHNSPYIDAFSIGSVVHRADGRRFIVTKDDDGIDLDEFQLDNYYEGKESRRRLIGVRNGKVVEEGSGISLPIIEAPCPTRFGTF